MSGYEMSKENVAELSAQLDAHDNVVIVDADSGQDLEVTSISYDSELDRVVVEVAR